MNTKEHCASSGARFMLSALGFPLSNYFKKPAPPDFIEEVCILIQ
jgi:hypothetical protein